MVLVRKMNLNAEMAHVSQMTGDVTRKKIAGTEVMKTVVKDSCPTTKWYYNKVITNISSRFGQIFYQ